MTEKAERGRAASDELFDALADGYRRRLLVTLLHDAPDDRQLSPERVGPNERTEASAIDMRHRHLPKLAAMGLIDWDRETNAVATGPTFDAVRPLLELLDDHGDELPGEWP